MARFDLESYVTVNDRIAEFWAKYPNGRIVTELESIDSENATNRMVVIRAEIYHERDATIPIATGIAKEREGTLMVNKTSFVENCETSAIGRALANLGFLTEKRPSREEMEAAQRAEEEHTHNLNTIKAIAKAGTSELKEEVKEVWAQLKDDPTFARDFLNKINEAVEAEVGY